MGYIDNLLKTIFGKKELNLPKSDNSIRLSASNIMVGTPPLTATAWAETDNIKAYNKLHGGSIILKPPPLVIASTANLDYLDPRMAKDIPEFFSRLKEVSLNIQLTCTARLYKTQVALYAQGRQPLAEINRLRKLAGLPDINPKDAKKIVSWTLFSKHLVNYDDTDPNNDYSQAFDFVVLKQRKISWDIKVNVNQNKIPDYEEVGEIAESFGWVWGGRWKKNPDYPHIQLKA